MAKKKKKANSQIWEMNGYQWGEGIKKESFIMEFYGLVCETVEHYRAL